MAAEYITWEDLHAEVAEMTKSIDHKFEQIMSRTDDISKSVTAIEKNCISHKLALDKPVDATPREDADTKRIKYLVVISIVAIVFSVLNIGFDKIPALIKLFTP